MALLDHMDLVTSLPSTVSELLTVSEHIEEVETTHVPVETTSVNPSSRGFTTLSGLSVSLDLGTANQVGQTFFTTPFTMGSFLRPPPPPLPYPPSKLWFSRYGAPVPSGVTAIAWFAWGPRWVCSYVFSDATSELTGAVDGIGWSFPPFGCWISSTSNFFTEFATLIFSSQPSPSFLDWVVPASIGDCF